MPEFSPRQLDDCEVDVLDVMNRCTNPVSVTRIVRKVKPSAAAARIYGAIARLALDGYIVRDPQQTKIRYYAINEEHWEEIECQVTLKGAVDIYDLDDWVRTALWHSGAISPRTALSSGWVYTQLINVWGKARHNATPFTGADVFNSMRALAQAGCISHVLRDGTFYYFYTTQSQRDKTRKALADFPLMPGYLPPDPVAPPAQGDEAQAAPDAPPHQTLVDDLAYGTLPVYRLTTDEVLVLREALKRKNAFGPFIISRPVFKDTAYSSPFAVGYSAAARQVVARIKLRAQPALESLARKNLLVGVSFYSGDQAGACKHDNFSTYRWSPLSRVMALYSLEFTTGEFHCRACGATRPALEVLCVQCTQAQKKVKPGTVPITNPDDVRVLHAVYALAGLGHGARPRDIGIFAFHAPAGFDVQVALNLAHDYSVLPDFVQITGCLRRLEEGGYVMRKRGRYKMTEPQYAWVITHYASRWPHLLSAQKARDEQEAAALARQTAVTYTARSSRVIELD